MNKLHRILIDLHQNYQQKRFKRFRHPWIYRVLTY